MNQAQDTLLKACPTEIVCKIFELSITTSCTGLQPEPADGHWKRPPQFSPLDLGAISKAWRDTAWSHPQLWSTIAIQLDSTVFATSSGYEIAKGWFQRSGCLPLDIRIYLHISNRQHRRHPGALDDRVRPTDEQKARVLNLVRRYSHRWMFLDVQLPSRLLARTNFYSAQRDPNSNLVDTSRPRVQLEGLRIHDDTNPAERDFRNPGAYQMFLSDYHAPRTLRLIDASISHIQGIKWKDLMIFSANAITTGDLLTIISNAPCLESFDALDLHKYESESELALPNTVGLGPRTTHKSLRKIRFDTGIDGLEIFRIVTMPSLTCIDLTVEVDDDDPIPPSTQYPPSIAILSEFFERSQPPLSTFAMEIPDISISHTLEFLHTLPSTLTDITLRRGFTPELWTGILNRFGRPCDALGGRILFPNIKNITFEHPDYEPTLTSRCWEITTDALYSVLSGRKGPYFKNLQQLNIIYHTSPKTRRTMTKFTPKTIGMRTKTAVKLADLIKRHRLPLHMVVKLSMGSCDQNMNTMTQVGCHHSDRMSDPFYDLVTLEVDNSFDDRFL